MKYTRHVVFPFSVRRAVVTKEGAFQARTATSSPLSELAEMTEEEFRVAFKGSAVKRAKWRGFRGDVAAALLNEKDAAQCRRTSRLE